MGCLRITALTFVLFATASNLIATFTPTFASHSDFTAGSSPQAVAIADLNGDGRDDMAIANNASNSVSVLFNTTAPAATAPTFATKVDFTTGTTPSAVTIADLNGDGKRDLVVANLAGSVSILRNITAIGATTPAFATKQDFTTTAFTPRDIIAGDVNGDGAIDVVVSCNGSPNIAEVFLNTTAPGAVTFTFLAHQDFQANSAGGVAMADLNGDGVPELVVSGNGSDFVTVLRNTTAPGATTVSFVSQNFVTGSAPWGVAIADLNGDGKPDLAIACLGTPEGLSVLLNTTATGATTFVFSPHQELAGLNNPQAVAIRDFNGDGKPDVAITGQGSANVSIFVNLTAPGATSITAGRYDFGTGTTPWTIAAGDFNGDGKPDVVTANSSQLSGSNNVSVLLNTTEVCCAAAPIYFTVRQDFATPTTPKDVTVGDFNGDGKPDLAVVDFVTSQVSVLLNTTAPGVTATTFAARQDFSASVAGTAVRVADLNGDGRPDMVTISAEDNHIQVFRNTTTPGATTATFAAKQAVVSSFGNESLAIIDVNGDGKPDLVIPNSNFDAVLVVLNQTAAGASSFTFGAAVSFPALANPTAVAAGDVNGDGKPDLAVVNPSLNNVSVLLNLTPPGSTQSFGLLHSFTTGLAPSAVTIRDLNGDGKADLAVSSQSSNAMSVLVSTTAPGADPPTFAAHQDFATGVGPGGHIAVGDLDNDGRPDLGVANLSANTLSVLLNTTTPGATTLTFTAKADLTPSSGPASSEIADFNGDGLPDLAVANSLSDTVSVFMSTFPVSIVVNSGSPQSVPITAPFAPLTALIRNASGIAVQLAPVTYVVNFMGAIGGSFAGPTSVLSDGSGIATSPVLTANVYWGTYSVTATLTSSGTFALFSLTNQNIGAPTNFTATATTPTAVLVTWDAKPYAVNYSLRRYTPSLGWIVLASHTTSLSFADSTASANTAYLYKVNVDDPTIEPFPGFPAFDLATTVIFTDLTLTPGSTIVKEAHFTQLRTAVNAVRVLAGQGAVSFTDSPLFAGSTVIKAYHLGDLRLALDGARSLLSLPAIVYTHTPPVTGTPITAADINDLRNGVK